MQQELAAGFDDISNPGRENALFAGQLFINKIGNPVTGSAQLISTGQVGSTAQGDCFLRVVKPETRLHPAIRATRNTACDERIGAFGLPVRVIDRCIFIEHDARCIDQLEQAAALEIGTHCRGNDARSSRLAEQIGNRHRNPVGPGTGNFDRKLGLGESCGQQGKSQENAAGDSLHCLHFQ
ncbi:MAG: hypothetical protein ACD_10C00487G0003 [uncultured bacterium]|nr:MAG: hypothetical protein ACD_10C00487G0003 [uncultured bacterium]